MSTVYSIGQMNQVADALETAGYTPDDVTKLRSKLKEIRGFKLVLGGMSEIVAVKHVIDLDADPMVPDYLDVEEHIKGGQRVWNPDEVELYLCDEQREGTIEGNKLRELLKDKHVLNATVLDYLLANPHLIPDEWRGRTVFFWGTIYRDSRGRLYVRYLYWSGDGWYWDCYWLVDYFDDSDPAALSRK